MRALATKRLLQLLLERYERSSVYERPGPWPRDVIVKLDERTFPDEWSLDGAEAREALLDAACTLGREGVVEVRFHKGFARDIPKEVRLTADVLPKALERAKSVGFRPAVSVLCRLADHASSLLNDDLPAWLSGYLAAVSEQLRQGDTSLLGASIGRVKVAERRFTDVLTAVASIGGGAEGMTRIVSERIFRDSKRLAAIAADVSNVLLRADPAWSVRPSRVRDVLASYGLRSKPVVLACAGGVRITAPSGVRDLRDDQPYAPIAESLTSALEDGLVQHGELVITTVENETPFLLYVESAGGPAGLADRGEFVMYTGGFPTPRLRGVLSRVAERAPRISFRHWGDPDAGGLQIWWNLRSAIGRPVDLYRMSPEWYRRAAERGGRPISSGQRAGLLRLGAQISEVSGPDIEQARALIEEVLRVGVWVEQERFGAEVSS